MSTLLTCQDCGWQTRPGTPARAAYSMRIHSCAKQLAKTAAAERGRARRAAIDRTPKPCPHPIARHQHGTYACYVCDGCHCQACAAANSAYERRRTRQQAYGRWNGLLDAEPVREHIRALKAAGLGQHQIQAAARISSGTWAKLLYGLADRPPSRRVRPTTTQRLLAIPIPRPDQLADGQTIDGTGAARRLRALACLGWSIQALADRCGADRQRFDHAVAGGPILARTHRQVAALYEELWDTPRSGTGQRERISVSRTLARAARLRWAPPLAWDDDTIDDPAAAAPATDTDPELIDEVAVERLMAGTLRPTTDSAGRVTAGRAEVLEAIRRLTDRGMAAAAIADRLRVTQRTITRLRAATRDPIAS